MKPKLGVSKRAYARRIGVDHSLVVRLCREGRLPMLPDGSLDPAACDRARQQNTAPRIPPLSVPGRLGGRVPGSGGTPRRCQGCGGRFLPSQAAEFEDNPCPSEYCTFECYADVGAGKTREQIRARLRKELAAGGSTKEELATDGLFDWVREDGSNKVPK